MEIADGNFISSDFAQHVFPGERFRCIWPSAVLQNQQQTWQQVIVGAWVSPQISRDAIGSSIYSGIGGQSCGPAEFSPNSLMMMPQFSTIEASSRWMMHQASSDTPEPNPDCVLLNSEASDKEHDPDDLSVNSTLKVKSDALYVDTHNPAIVAKSRSAARSHRRRQLARAKLAQTQSPSTLSIAQFPPLDEVIVTLEIKDLLMHQLDAGGHERVLALTKIRGSVIQMSFEPYGCRVVQKAFDVADMKEKQLIVQELRGHVREAIASPHANFVIQKVIEDMPMASANFIAEELLTFAADAARHRFACRILCRLMEHHLCDKSGYKTASLLVDELLMESKLLVRHIFAHYVSVSILEHGSARQQANIIATIRSNVFANAKNPYASYIVQQIISICYVPERDALASDLVSDYEGFWALATHATGHYVIKALLTSHGSFAVSARELLNARVAKLCTSKYGQRLLKEI